MSASSEAIHIVHVDDEPGFADTAAQFLEREEERFVVETATAAGEALEYLGENEVDCIVSDYDMPERNGLEFLEAVRERDAELPFILFTGKGSEEVASDAITAGVTDYLQKEGGTDQYTVLTNRIRNAVERTRAKREQKRQLDAIETAREGISILDENGRFIYVNEAYADLYGYEPDGMIGEHWGLIYPEGDVEEISEKVIPEVKETGHWHGTTTGLRADGSTFVEDHVLAMTEYGELVCTVRDISDKRARERELEDERAFIDQALDTLEDVFYVVGEDGTLRRWNDRFSEVTGYTDEEMADMQAVEFFPEDERDRIVEAIDESLTTGGTTVESELLTADGDRLPYELTGSRLTDHAGNIIGLVGIGRNIAGRKQHERELERTADLLDRTERIADVGGWEIDTETTEVYWTEHLFEILGVEGDEEPPLTEALDAYHEEDRSTVEEAVEAALETGDPFDIEARFRHPDGEIRWLRLQGTPTVEDGRVKTLRGAVQDITERRSRGRVLREMYEIISDRNQSFEEQIQALLDLGRAELGTQYGNLSSIHGDEYVFEIVSADDEDIQPGDVVPVSATNCEIVATTEQTLVLGDIERDAPEETDRAGFTEWGISCYLGAPVFVDDGVYGTFCFYDTETRAEGFSEWEQTLVDLMSRWASSELQRQQVNERLLEQNEQLEQFTSVVSHDLRNPLSVADGRLKLAESECDSEHLEHVARAHDRMEALIDDLLTLAREGKQVTDRELVDLSDIAESCWRNVETADATIVVESDGTIRADRSRLQQLFENLMRNAVDHGGETVTVTIGRSENGFYVEDDGPGIPEADRDEIFELGYSTSEAGTGFGLGIVKQVVDAHGWEIRITDSAAGGARFEITGVEFADE